MAPPTNRKGIWYHPRDDKSDRLLSYVVEARQFDKNKQDPLSPHPLAASDPNYEGLVFLFREPADPSGAFAKDWYGPLNLADPVLRVSTAGAGYQSGVLYARGSTPPTEDPRIEYKGPEVADHVMSWAWVDDPATALPGPSFVLLTSPDDFTGDEVYLDITDVGDIPGIDIGTFEIVRHISAKSIHIAVPYDATVTPADPVNGTSFEACYILDGYSDAESAPGVLADKFHVRSFTYRLATPSFSHQWDESLGLELTQENRAVPSTWAKNWDVGYTSAATSTDSESTGYQAASKLVHNRVRSGITGSPTQDGITWPGMMRLRVPAVLRELCIPWVWAQADSGGYSSYNEDWGVAQDVWGPGELGTSTVTHRKISTTADIDTTITDYIAAMITAGDINSGVLFSFHPESYSLKIGSWKAHSGDNIWTKAQIRPFSVGPFLLSGADYTFTNPVPALPGGAGVSIDGSSVTFTPTTAVPWGTSVLWDVSVTKARWGYWIIDFTTLVLPASPV